MAQMNQTRTYGQWLNAEDNTITWEHFEHNGEKYVMVNDGTYCWTATRDDWNEARAVAIGTDDRDDQEIYTDFCGLCSYDRDGVEAWNAEYPDRPKAWA